MKVFDFDNTLYHGESSVDLALYMIKTNRKIIKYLPSIFFNLIKYKLCTVDKRKMVRVVNNFMRNALRDKNELFDAVDGFWKENRRKLDRRMLKRIDKDDVIITAGPDFLIYGIRDILNTDNIICSSIDPDKMKVRYLNFGANKAKRYKELYGDKSIDCFYTDSFNDKALMDISERVFIVKKGRLRRIK
ncbi:haloacid dehalogenase-like hydrolase [Ruminococcus sp.]|uniref:haloacid dehalogenase-like hydrolase n=1 Tax=Ruminococcus sp. TaxID=41978 RepID=UPI001B739F17|nr:haloacid dehalogenase-like hydrolase [Ruminococcus sp.]MBP5430709.1 haloacid dehalogenase-like hydrolase [Ruminococcus sp.]